jgi:hypothetical protein
MSKCKWNEVDQKCVNLLAIVAKRRGKPEIAKAILETSVKLPEEVSAKIETDIQKIEHAISRTTPGPMTKDAKDVATSLVRANAYLKETKKDIKTSGRIKKGALVAIVGLLLAASTSILGSGPGVSSDVDTCPVESTVQSDAQHLKDIPMFNETAQNILNNPQQVVENCGDVTNIALVNTLANTTEASQKVMHDVETSEVELEPEDHWALKTFKYAKLAGRVGMGLTSASYKLPTSDEMKDLATTGLGMAVDLAKIGMGMLEPDQAVQTSNNLENLSSNVKPENQFSTFDNFSMDEKEGEPNFGVYGLGEYNELKEDQSVIEDLEKNK